MSKKPTLSNLNTSVKEYIDNKSETSKDYTDKRLLDIDAVIRENGSVKQEEIDKLKKANIEQSIEIANLKLMQEASQRIEDGVTFGDNMNGSRFGFTFNQSESKNVTIKDGSMLMKGGSTTKEEALNDITVANKAYDTSSNGGRKLVRLDNRYYVSATRENGTTYQINVSWDGGKNWTFHDSGTYSSMQDNCIVTNGTNVYSILAVENSTIRVTRYKDGLSWGDNTDIDTSQTALGQVTAIINEARTEIHVAWSSKNVSYRNNFNIRYVKGTIRENGSVMWGAVEQLTDVIGGDNLHLTLTLNHLNNPLIIYTWGNGSKYNLCCNLLEESMWNRKVFYSSDTDYIQSSPSIIFVPKTINGLAKGRIWLTFMSVDSTYPNMKNLYICYSDNGGWDWSSMLRVTNISNTSLTDAQNAPSITANHLNEIFISYSGKTFKSKGDLSFTEISIGKSTPMASMLFDNTFNYKFTSPTFIYKDTSKVGFYGSIVTTVEEPVTSATAIYDLPSTDYIGAFIKREGNITVDAYLNDMPMDEELDNNEYMFIKSLDSNVPAKLRLELSRPDVTNGDNDKVTKILGGRS